MRTSIKLAVLATFLAAGIAQAATTSTQMVQTVNLTLTATVQGPTTATGATVTMASVGNKDIITAVGKALNTNFTSKAKLLLITPPDISASKFFVRDVANKQSFDTDVNVFFTKSIVGEVVKSMISHGKTTGTVSQIGKLSLDTPTLSFQLLGFSTLTIQTGGLNSSGVGAGAINTNDAVFKGNATIGPFKAETVTAP